MRIRPESEGSPSRTKLESSASGSLVWPSTKPQCTVRSRCARNRALDSDFSRGSRGFLAGRGYRLRRGSGAAAGAGGGIRSARSDSHSDHRSTHRERKPCMVQSPRTESEGCLMVCNGRSPDGLLGGLLFAKAPLPALTRGLGAFLLFVVFWRHAKPRTQRRFPIQSFAIIGAAASFLSALLGSVDLCSFSPLDW